MKDEIRIAAPAKVNLSLRITGRRPDGYHELATLMQKIDLSDQLILKRAASGIHLTCPGSSLPENRENLVYRAAKLFFAVMASRLSDPKPGVAITLKKNIPVAAGLGGGSSDAAAVLLGLAELFSVECSREELCALGLRLGADVPFFISALPAAWAMGVGEILQPVLSLNGFLVLLVNPDFCVSTKWAFETFALTVGKKIFNLTDLQFMSVESDKGGDFAARIIRPEEMTNDLELVTIERYPEIRAIKKQLLTLGATGALMSGSGPTVFGIFPANRADQANTCLIEMKRRYQRTYLVHPLC